MESGLYLIEISLSFSNESSHGGEADVEVVT